MHISCNDGVIKLSPLSFYAVLEVVEISHECFFYILSCSILYTLVNYRFKSGEFGGHSRGRMNSGVSLLAKTVFLNDVTIMSSLRMCLDTVYIKVGRIC